MLLLVTSYLCRTSWVSLKVWRLLIKHVSYDGVACPTVLTLILLSDKCMLEWFDELVLNADSELVDLPVEHLVSKIDQKILINCGAGEYEKASDSMYVICLIHFFLCIRILAADINLWCRYVLDLSLVKGGAPGRTRGLNLFVTNPSTDRVNDENQLS